jgi:hypothetical protein
MSSHERTPPARVRVTGPPRRPSRGARTAAAREIDAETALGEVFMSSLLREQLRLAVAVLAALGATLGLLPLVFFLAPDLAGVHLGPLSLPWLLLSFLTYPWLVLLGWVYVRRSEANERDFAELLTTASEDS